MTTTTTVSFDLGVHYGQAYLVDATDDAMGPEDLLDDHPAHPVGIIRVEDGNAFLITGICCRSGPRTSRSPAWSRARAASSPTGAAPGEP